MFLLSFFLAGKDSESSFQSGTSSVQKSRSRIESSERRFCIICYYHTRWQSLWFRVGDSLDILTYDELDSLKWFCCLTRAHKRWKCLSFQMLWLNSASTFLIICIEVERDLGLFKARGIPSLSKQWNHLLMNK
jgi:hypothetical protein